MPETRAKAASAQTKMRWRSEKTAAYLSRAVADAEPDPQKSALFRGMAESAEAQAAILARDLGGAPEFRLGLRARVVAWLVKAIGPRACRAILSAIKVRGISVYSGPAAAPLGHPLPATAAHIGQRHRAGAGGVLRASVFGANDGLISNACLVMGVAGADMGPQIIVITGVAGLLAGAFSMAAGEYVSMRSQRELFEHQIAEERQELERYPDEEAEELAMIYSARGIPLAEARDFSRRLIANPKVALDTLAREELGLNPDDLGSPWGAATGSFAAFALGAVVPLVPFFLGFGAEAVPAAAALSGVCLFAIGTLLSLFSGRNALFGGARMLLIGALAAGATYLIGSAFGVAAS